MKEYIGDIDSKIKSNHKFSKEEIDNFLLKTLCTRICVMK